LAMSAISSTLSLISFTIVLLSSNDLHNLRGQPIMLKLRRAYSASG
jgi:hypothetical protein